MLWQLGYGSCRKLGVPYFGILIIRILLCRVLYLGPLFSETPILGFEFMRLFVLGDRVPKRCFLFGVSQTLQYPLIKEDSFNHFKILP